MASRCDVLDHTDAHSLATRTGHLLFALSVLQYDVRVAANAIFKALRTAPPKTNWISSKVEPAEALRNLGWGVSRHVWKSAFSYREAEVGSIC